VGSISQAMRRLAQLPRGVAVVIAVVATIWTIGFDTVIRAPCVSTTASGDFRWCSTQFTELYVLESIEGGRLPYLDACVPVGGDPCDEYPVLTMYAMRLTGWVSSGIEPFFYANALLMLLCALIISVLLARRVGMRALYFALAPTLALYGLMNWDLLGVVLMVAAVEAYLRDRQVAAGVALGLSAATKFFPALLLVPLAADLLGRGRRSDVVRLAGAAVGAWAVVNVPFAVAAPEGWGEFFRFNSARPPDIDSLWYAVCHRVVGEVPCLETGLVNAASLIVFASAVAAVWWAKWRRDPHFERWTLAFPVIVLFFLANKVYSPQYSLWLLPLFALLLPDLRLFAAFGAAEVAIFLTRYQVPLEPPLLGFQLAVLARDAVLIGYVVAWVRRPLDQRSSLAAGADGSVTGSLQVKRSPT
jgi:uncharacterized membrane protein